MNLLDANPRLRQDCAGFLVQALNQQRKDNESQHGYFEEVSTLAKIPEPFLVAWVCSKSGFTAGDLGTAKVQDKDILGNILEFLLLATKNIEDPRGHARQACCKQVS